MGSLEEECPAPVAQGSCRTPPPLATTLPNLGNQNQLGQDWEVGSFAGYTLLPCLGPPSQHTPDYKGFSPFSPVDVHLSRVLTRY